MTRNGKIARLPAAIREELNQRLFDGEQGKQLVEWLNTLPKVQAVMQASFEGRPITEDNLSEWKMGGYAAWEAGQRLAEKLRRVLEGTDVLQQVAKHGLTDRMALILGANLILEMQRLEETPDGIEKAKVMRELRLGVLALKRTELYAMRLTSEKARHKTEKSKTKRMTPEEKQEKLMALLGINKGYDGTINPELTRPPAYGHQTESEPIGVNRSQSESIGVIKKFTASRL